METGLTYKIGEVAEMLNLKTYVLRFWETEFTQLAPVRTEKGQRLYTSADVELLRRIQNLLHEQGMTIDGARRILAGQEETGIEGKTIASVPDDQNCKDIIKMLQSELAEIWQLLERGA